MSGISDDTQFRDALNGLSVAQQRQVGAMFVERLDQAGYFVAHAAEACHEPESRAGGKGPAWKAAMNARMARTCLAADSDEDSHDSESHGQYQILTSYLDA